MSMTLRAPCPWFDLSVWADSGLPWMGLPDIPAAQHGVGYTLKTQTSVVGAGHTLLRFVFLFFFLMRRNSDVSEPT